MYSKTRLSVLLMAKYAGRYSESNATRGVKIPDITLTKLNETQGEKTQGEAITRTYTT